MALQHLYSRVPSKISMYNRADSFDTFAKSKNLEREFIEKELSSYSDIKLSAKENALLRDGNLQNLYFQYITKEGVLVQSCAGFVARDFTGERSSYLLHSLIFDKEEAYSISASPELNSFEPSMFESDINKFNITNPDLKPDGDYPELAYSAKPMEKSGYIEYFQDNTLQRFIFAALSVMCGKPKALYFSIGVDNDQTSEASLKFINEFLQILPYYMRPQFSFVTRVSDPGRFNGIKFKCVTDECPAVPPQKGWSVNLKTGMFAGFKDEDVGKQYAVVSFFFSLLKDDALRRDFLFFADKAYRNLPVIGTLSFDMLNNLILLFKTSSNRFEPDKVVANDDQFVNFINVYDKYRTALPDEYRIACMSLLRRYPETYKEIPKKVFSKLTKFYKSEPACSKLVIMNVALDLIHTDVMREKLFNFISENYHNEPDDIKEKIMSAFARVYYGGFLMPQILGFFSSNYDSASQKMRDDILEKVMLAVRTKEMRSLVIEFFDRNFSYFTNENKEKFFRMALENIVEGDELARDLVALLNKYLPQEPVEVSDTILALIFKRIESEQRKKTHHLTDVLASTGGFCSLAISRKVMTDWSSRQVFEDYIKALCIGNAMERAKNILFVLNSCPEASRDTLDRMFDLISEHFFDEELKESCYAYIDASDYLIKCADESPNVNAGIFARAMAKKVWSVCLGRTAMTFFSLGLDEDRMLDFAADYPLATEERPFKYVLNAIYLKMAASQDDLKACVAALKEVLKIKSLVSTVSRYVKKDQPDSMLTEIVLPVLTEGRADFDAAYRKYAEKNEYVAVAMLSILAIQACDLIEEGKSPVMDSFFPERSGYETSVRSFIQNNGKTGKEKLLACFDGSSDSSDASSASRHSRGRDQAADEDDSQSFGCTFTAEGSPEALARTRAVVDKVAPPKAGLFSFKKKK